MQAELDVADAGVAQADLALGAGRHLLLGEVAVAQDIATLTVMP